MEEQNKIGVYIKLNSNNEIIDVNSDVFIKDLTNWIKIDEGVGDKYSHAQSQYFEKNKKYKFIDNKIIEEDIEEDIDYLTPKLRRLTELSKDIIQVSAGVIVEDIKEKKREFRELLNEVRAIQGKEPKLFQ